ncbi:MAG: ATP-dependent Clp protease adaptor protein ClpS [Candidatus Kapaibacterium sp.]|jgi:ATP-dependent Clp protease adapter protein ClpS|nr:MAG: ATP-dependent Clp protease adaptor protein ClpS [Candidatus Kapabacteria bacterium]ROL56695.1 MAG: ATP-dependent Clp protease adaptor ClpS [Bacteroidetes/Chlorobi group bacterium Naka2016]
MEKKKFYFSTQEKEETLTIDSTGVTFPARVILFNDDVHTFEEVALQLVKAIHCTYERGLDIAWEVHTKGKACVYEGDIGECLRVSAILEEIALHTQIET